MFSRIRHYASPLACLATLSGLNVLIASANAFVPPQPSFSGTSTYKRQNDPLAMMDASLMADPLAIMESSLTIADGALSSAWSSYNDALDSSPLTTKSITAGIILGAADATGQFVERSTKVSADGEEAPFDIARAARFGFFGLVLQAPWNHFYYLLLDGALPPTVDPFTATTGIKVMIDQFVQAPIFTVIIFAFLGFLEGKTSEQIKKQLDDDYTDTMLANWKLWVPATMVNIAFCPPVLRVLFLNCVFFFWSIFLSIKLNKEEEEAA